MVRQKNRWLLVKLDFQGDIQPPNQEPSPTKSNKRRRLRESSGSNLSESSSTQLVHQVNSADIYRSLQEVITQNFGLVGASTSDVQVRLYDPKVRLAIIKTSRDKYPLVRSSLTFMTHIKQGGDAIKVVASTIAVSGSARTARNAAWGELQKQFYGQDLDSLGVKRGEPWAKKSKLTMEKRLKELEARLESIDSSC
ncbi:hypothetical protein ACHAWF_017940 [Thalassiosira exigua]